MRKSRPFALAMIGAMVAGVVATLPAQAEPSALSGVAAATASASSATGSLSGGVGFPLTGQWVGRDHPGASVSAVSVAGDTLATAPLDAVGNYVLDGLAIGAEVTVLVNRGKNDAFLSTYAGGVLRRPDATFLTVVDPDYNPVPVINVVLSACVSGTVVGLDGEPATKARVVVTSIGRSGGADVVVDSDGNFQAQGLPAGRASVWVSYGGSREVPRLNQYIRRTEMLETNGQCTDLGYVQLWAFQTGKVAGTVKRVEGSGSGQVTLTDTGGYTYKAVKPSRKGKVLFKRVPPGTYVLRVAGSARIQTVKVKARKVSTFSRVTLKKAAVLKGTVRFVDGTRASEGTVYLRDSTRKTVGVGEVSKSGTYTIKGIGAGTYKATLLQGAEDETQGVARATITLKAGRATVRSFRFAKEATISGVVKDSAGRPVADIEVVAFGVDCVGYTETAADGSYTLHGLGKGPWRLEATDHYVGGYRFGYYGGTSETTIKALTVKTGQHLTGKNLTVRK